MAKNPPDGTDYCLYKSPQPMKVGKLHAGGGLGPVSMVMHCNGPETSH